MISTTVSRRTALASVAAGIACCTGPARAAHMVKPWPAAKPVPALEVTDLDGRPWKLSGFAGQVVVLNFWATWCEPCRAEMPTLDALAGKQKKAGLVVAAINVRENAQKVRGFVDGKAAHMAVLLDADGDAATDWMAQAFPTTVVVGRDGRPQVTIVGEYDWSGAEAAALLAPLLAAPKPAKKA